MCLTKRHARPQLVDSSLETGQMDVVDFRLAVGEPLAHRHGRREVAGIVPFVLCSGVEQEDVAIFQGVYEPVVVEHLSLHGGNGGEGQRVAVPAGHLLDGGSHLRLVYARAHHAVGRQVHLRAQVHALFYFAQLVVVFVVALVDNGPDHAH